MYCSNCGTKLEDSVKFCSNCGAEICKRGTENTDNSLSGIVQNHYYFELKHLVSSKNFYSIISIIITVIIIAMMFFKWFEIPLLSYVGVIVNDYIDLPSKFSVIDLITNFIHIINLENFENLDINEDIMMIIVFFLAVNILLWITILYCLAVYIKIMIQAQYREVDKFNMAMIMTIILAGFNIICMICINNSVKNDIMDYMSIKAMSINKIIYVMAVIALISKIFLVWKVAAEIKAENK